MKERLTFAKKMMPTDRGGGKDPGCKREGKSGDFKRATTVETLFSIFSARAGMATRTLIGS